MPSPCVFIDIKLLLATTDTSMRIQTPILPLGIKRVILSRGIVYMTAADP